MDFPKFNSDQEMAEWFEANDVDPSQLEPADDVVIADDLKVVVTSDLYCVTGANVTASATTAAPTEGRALVAS